MKAARPVRRGGRRKSAPGNRSNSPAAYPTRGRPLVLGRAFVDETCYLLPAPTLQRPDLLTTLPDTPPDVDCAAALDLTDQDPTINQMMASLVIQIVRRMVAGTCPFMGLYLDMELGTVTPTYATPEAVERVMGSNSEDGEGPFDALEGG